MPKSQLLLNLAALVSGALLPLGLAPFGLWPLAILSCALFSSLLAELGPRQAWWRSFYYGLGLFGAGVSWVYISIHTHGGESVAISLLLTGLFVLVLTLAFALPFSLYGRLPSGHSGVRLLAFPALWVLVEWLRGWLFTGFPWLYLGNSFTDTRLAGWAPIGGVLLLSLVGALSGAVLAELGRRRRETRPWLAAAAATALLWLGGAALAQVSWTTAAGQPLTLAMVQPALTPSQKWNDQILTDILVQLSDQSEAHWGRDLLIWPESAIPNTRERVAPFVDYADSRARESGTTLITGIPIKENGRYYNGVILLGAGEGSYRKRHLVPFGEYLPLDSLLRGIIGFFDRPMSSFSAGGDHQPLLLAKGIAIATAICYEIVFQDLVSATARDADLILTISNDVWFGDSIAPHQHLQMARLRAIENAKPVVRGTNDGITAVIDARGQVTARLPQFVPATLTAEVTPHSGSTPFNRWGSWPVVLLCGGLVATALGVSRLRLQVSRSAP